MAERKQEIYEKFIAFIQDYSQTQRIAVNRRVFHVFLWCFLIPLGVVIGVLVGGLLGIFPPFTKKYIDWIILLFPICYTIYFLSAEVLKGIPQTVRRGGLASALKRPLAEGQWREATTQAMRKEIKANAREWAWVAESFRMDLRAIQWRNRYLTMLAGAVFFLIMEGIDALDGQSSWPATWTPVSFLYMVELVFDKIASFVGLGFFLVMLYLSGSQVHQNLERFLNCVDLICLDEDL